MGEAEELCDRVGIMLGGRIVELDTPDRLKARYQVNGHLPTLEEVFMAATGSSLEDADLKAQEREEKAGAR
jgi:ABC-2 type transport system ATP-binding protein